MLIIHLQARKLAYTIISSALIKWMNLRNIIFCIVKADVFLGLGKRSLKNTISTYKVAIFQSLCTISTGIALQ